MNKIAIVTGAVSGIGLGVSKKLFHENYHVLAMDKDEEKLHALQEEMDHPKVAKYTFHYRILRKKRKTIIS